MKLIIFVGLIAVATSIDLNRKLKEGNEQFTAKLFDAVANLPENVDSSLILSAFSLMPLLTQLSFASSRQSHDEILNTIGLNTTDELNGEIFSNLNARLSTVKGVDLKMANRIYVANDAELNPTYANLSRDVFKSDIRNVDFSQNVAAANAINTWVEEQTNNKIKNLVDPSALSSFTRVVLVNALYFKGSWHLKFNPLATRDGDFHVTKDKTVKVPMMHQTATFRYAESSELDAKLLEMPYAGGEASFLVVLPNKVDGLKELLVKLRDPAALPRAVDDMFNNEVKLSLPKFKIETTTNLKEALKMIQINDLFDPSKNSLTNLLSNERTYVSDAIQKAFIEVNEEGAEAAAANEIGVAYLSGVISETYQFIADHPFVFYLKEEENILFSGMYQS